MTLLPSPSPYASSFCFSGCPPFWIPAFIATRKMVPSARMLCIEIIEDIFTCSHIETVSLCDFIRCPTHRQRPTTERHQRGGYHRTFQSNSTSLLSGNNSMRLFLTQGPHRARARSDLNRHPSACISNLWVVPASTGRDRVPKRYDSSH